MFGDAFNKAQGQACMGALQNQGLMRDALMRDATIRERLEEELRRWINRRDFAAGQAKRIEDLLDSLPDAFLAMKSSELRSLLQIEDSNAT